MKIIRVIDARKLYPDNIREDCFYSEYDYSPIIDAIGETLIRVDDNDYSGDSRILFRDRLSGKFGILIFGWGSCSGCDALQACNSYEELQELINKVQEDVIWFDSKDEALLYFQNHDWEGDFYGRDDNTNEFIALSLSYLNN